MLEFLSSFSRGLNPVIFSSQFILHHIFPLICPKRWQSFRMVSTIFSFKIDSCESACRFLHSLFMVFDRKYVSNGHKMIFHFSERFSCWIDENRKLISRTRSFSEEKIQLKVTYKNNILTRLITRATHGYSQL